MTAHPHPGNGTNVSAPPGDGLPGIPATGRLPNRAPLPPPPPAGRLAYVDMLKGFAIFCVVMGHFLAWTFAPDADRGQYPVFVKNILYTFHLPLFFFLSGFVADFRQREWNLGVWGRFVGKRALSLLVPGLTFMALSFLDIGQWSFPWFLAALFEMLLLFSVPRWLASRFGASWPAEMAAHGLVWAGLAGYVATGGTGAWQQFVSLKLMVVFHPFFLFGRLACCWNLPKRIEEWRWMYTLALLLYAAVLGDQFAGARIPASVAKYPLGVCAIVVFLRLAMDIRQDSRTGRTFGLLGRNSLCIYLLSAYFIPCFPALGDLFVRSDAFGHYGISGFRHVTSVFLQLTTGILVASYVCVACLLAKKVVEKSAVLDFLLFGTLKRR